MFLEKLRPTIRRRVKEDKFFKRNFRYYCAVHFSDRKIELWAYSVRREVTSDYLLGTIEHGYITKPADFYTLPWDVQKGAERLMRIMGV